MFDVVALYFVYTVRIEEQFSVHFNVSYIAAYVYNAAVDVQLD